MPGARRVVPSAVHPERSGDLVVEQDIQSATGDLIQEQLECDEVQVGVPVHGPGSLLRTHRPQQPQPALTRGLLVERRPRAQPRGVREQLTDRDHLLAAPGEQRQVPAHRSLQLQPAPLHLLHGQDGGEQLRQRGQVEDGVLGHRDPLGRRELPHPVGPAVVVRVPHGVAHGAVQGDGAAPAREDHRAGVVRVFGGGAQEPPRLVRHPLKVPVQQPGLARGSVPQPQPLERAPLGRAARRPGGAAGQRGVQHEHPAEREQPCPQAPPARPPPGPPAPSCPFSSAVPSAVPSPVAPMSGPPLPDFAAR